MSLYVSFYYYNSSFLSLSLSLVRSGVSSDNKRKKGRPPKSKHKQTAVPSVSSLITSTLSLDLHRHILLPLHTKIHASTPFT